MTSDETTEPNRVTLANLKGEMKEGFSQITGAMNTLATEVRGWNDARIAEITHLSSSLSELVSAERKLEDRVNALEKWQVAQETAAKEAPRLTWGRFFEGTRLWVPVVLAVLGVVVGKFVL